jgi:hypothetical protein
VDQLAVADEHHAVGDRGRQRVVGDHQRRLAELVDHRPQELEDLSARARVEVAGRLVGEHDRGPRHERARHRHPLLLAAGELARAVREPVGEPDLVHQLAVPRVVGLLARDAQRNEHVLLRGQHREQVEELEDESDPGAAELRQLGVVEPCDLRAVDRDRPGRRPVEAREDVHERGLPGPRRAHDGRQLPGFHADRDAAQRPDGRLALAESTRHLVGGQDVSVGGHVGRP